jgi:hypothetical protein
MGERRQIRARKGMRERERIWDISFEMRIKKLKRKKERD